GSGAASAATGSCLLDAPPPPPPGTAPRAAPAQASATDPLAASSLKLPGGGFQDLAVLQDAPGPRHPCPHDIARNAQRVRDLRIAELLDEAQLDDLLLLGRQHRQR